MKKLDRVTQKIYNEIRDEMRNFSTWDTKLDLEVLGDQLLNGGYQPQWNRSFEGINFDLKLAIHNDTYCEEVIQNYPVRMMDREVLKFLNDIYLEGAERPSILDRVEMLHAVFCTKSQTECDTLMIAPFTSHPRFRQQLDREAIRLGDNELVRSLFRINGASAFSTLLSWKHEDAPDFKSTTLLSKQDYEFLMSYMRKHFALEDVIYTTLGDYNYYLRVDPEWANAFDLEDLVSLGGYADIEHLFIGHHDMDEDTIAGAASTIALMKAMICQDTMEMLCAVSEQGLKHIRKRDILPARMHLKIGAATNEEKRDFMQRDFGL